MAKTISQIISVQLATAGDPDGTRTIVSIIVLLVAVGLGLVLVAVWLIRSTRPDPELLAPLEVMGERRWRRSEPVSQRRHLDELRPEGAEPLEPFAAPPDFDESFDDGPTAEGFADLDPAVQDVGTGDADQDGHDRIDQVGDDPTAAIERSNSDPAADEPTPPAIDRPGLDDMPVGDIDPEILAEAEAQLEAELRATTGGGSDAAPAE